jgi:hypothetical protein
MQATGFLNSLFDYSFRSFITPRIIKVLYVLLTIAVALWTLAIVAVAFQASSGAGIVTLLVVGPILFIVGMIYARVGLELLIVLFRIHGDVAEINVRGGGTPDMSGPAAAVADAPPVEAEPAPASPPATAFCADCGAERAADKRFCPACGAAFA